MECLDVDLIYSFNHSCSHWTQGYGYSSSCYSLSWSSMPGITPSMLQQMSDIGHMWSTLYGVISLSSVVALVKGAPQKEICKFQSLQPPKSNADTQNYCLENVSPSKYGYNWVSMLDFRGGSSSGILPGPRSFCPIANTVDGSEIPRPTTVWMYKIL